MNIKSAIAVIDKIAERNRSKSFLSKGESEMRLKLSDLRQVIIALENIPTKSINNEKINSSCDREIPLPCMCCMAPLELKHSGLIWHHPINSCVLIELRFANDPIWIHKWNTRFIKEVIE